MGGYSHGGGGGGHAREGEVHHNGKLFLEQQKVCFAHNRPIELCYLGMASASLVYFVKGINKEGGEVSEGVAYMGRCGLTGQYGRNLINCVSPSYH